MSADFSWKISVPYLASSVLRTSGNVAFYGHLFGFSGQDFSLDMCIFSSIGMCLRRNTVLGSQYLRKGCILLVIFREWEITADTHQSVRFGELLRQLLQGKPNQSWFRAGRLVQHRFQWTSFGPLHLRVQNSFDGFPSDALTTFFRSSSKGFAKRNKKLDT